MSSNSASTRALAVCRRFVDDGVESEDEKVLPYWVIYEFSKCLGHRFTLVTAKFVNKSVALHEGPTDFVDGRQTTYLKSSKSPGLQGRETRFHCFAKADNLAADKACALVQELNSAEVCFANHFVDHAASTYQRMCQVFGAVVAVGTAFITDVAAVALLESQLSRRQDVRGTDAILDEVAKLRTSVEERFDHMAADIGNIKRHCQLEDRNAVNNAVSKSKVPVPFSSTEECESFLSSSRDNYDMVRGIIGGHQDISRAKDTVKQQWDDPKKKPRYPAATILNVLFDNAARETIYYCTDGSWLGQHTKNLILDRARFVMGDKWHETDSDIITKTKKAVSFKRCAQNDRKQSNRIRKKSSRLGSD